MRKLLLALCAVIATCGAGTTAAAATKTITGTVLETTDAGGYTYLRLKTRDGERWAAISKAEVETGAKVTVAYAVVMQDFESKTLKKTFKNIVFGSLALPKASGGAGDAMAAAHAAATKGAKGTGAGDVRVAKATGPNARTVAAIITGKDKLKDKPVVLHARVVKFNGDIMGKNWLHLRDGTGSAADGTNDVVVNSKDTAKVGDVVTVKGIVRTDKDFGSGYLYKVLIEDASVRP